MNFFKKAYLWLIRKSFKFFETVFRVHVTPVHYFSPVPTLSELNDEVYCRETGSKGIEWNHPVQTGFIKEAAQKYAREFTPSENLGLSLVDAFVLYAMIREKKPQRMIEIGSGHSTLISLQALEVNAKEGNEYSFTAIEPYPIDDLKAINDPRFELMVNKVQDVPVSFFKEADLLFIDSTHICKINSDVNYEILEILPDLKKGCLIHWHDIVIPHNYRKEWMENGNMFFNESYVVHAFMLFNSAFQIQWASHYMQKKEDALLKHCFPYFKDGHYLSSFWIAKVH